MLDIERVVAMHGSTLMRVAVSYGASRQDAEDIVQEAFIKLLRSNQTFGSDEHLKAWLIRVTINLCIDCYRKKRTHPFVPLEDVPDASEQDIEQTIHLQSFLMQLPPQDRLLLHLSYYERYSSAEIGQMMGLKPGTVRAKIHRIKKRVKDEWK